MILGNKLTHNYREIEQQCSQYNMLRILALLDLITHAEFVSAQETIGMMTLSLDPKLSADQVLNDFVWEGI